MPTDLTALAAQLEDIEFFVRHPTMDRTRTQERSTALLRAAGALRACVEAEAEEIETGRAILALMARVKQTEAERDEARRFGEHAAEKYNELLGSRTLRCAFCDAEYHEGTPATQDAALAAHVGACEQHPMRNVEAERDAARADVARLRGALGELLAATEDCYDAAKRHLGSAAASATIRRMQQARAALAGTGDVLTAEERKLLNDWRQGRGLSTREQGILVAAFDRLAPAPRDTEGADG